MKDSLLVYFAYPYSESPKENTDEIRDIVIEIIKNIPEIVPIVPHLAFDAIFKIRSEGYSEEKKNIGKWCFEIILKCDIFWYMECEKTSKSKGVYWEKCFAEVMSIPVVESSELKNYVKGRLNGFCV